LEVNKDDVRERLRKAGAELMKPEFLQKRIVFNLPSGHEIKGGWARVRDEGDKITLSIKIVSGDKIEDQKEICLKVDDFEKAVELLRILGCGQKAFQENKRELWMLDGAEVTIDEWPFLEPYIEIEADSEAKVKSAAQKLGFDYSQAFFGAVGTVYAKEYKITDDQVNNHTPLIVFDMKNPFIR